MTSVFKEEYLTGYILGELDEKTQKIVEKELQRSPELREELASLREFYGVVEQELANEPAPELSQYQKQAIEQRLSEQENAKETRDAMPFWRRLIRIRVLVPVAATVAVCLGLYITLSMTTLKMAEAPADNRYMLRQRALSEQPQFAGVESMRAVKSAPIAALGYVKEDESARFNTESYSQIIENGFFSPREKPLSTFSIDVDTASYANVRRFLIDERLPPKDAVRIEELINYFRYDYPEPKERPFSVSTEIAEAPWNSKHRLLRIGIKGKELDLRSAPSSNLVFLVDTSGSMDSPGKLPLLKSALKMLLENLGPDDRVAIVAYAGSAGLVLDSTPANRSHLILEALERLSAGGSTNGGEGIELAYDLASHSFIRNGNNRVILATDGDFNVGVSSEGELVRLIENKRKRGVFLSVLGFGMGNYKDDNLEKLADKGNGNYAYIDSLKEARKVLVEQVGGTLFTIAKDVKLQIEFNPNEVEAYRLIGYENRVMAARDFADDTKDAGDIGAGHTVTAFYEIVPKGVEFEGLPQKELRYQESAKPSDKAATGELGKLSLRYKEPKEDTSRLIEWVLVDQGKSMEAASPDFKHAASVAGFGMLLRGSEYKGALTYDVVLQLALQGLRRDNNEYRREFISLIHRAARLSSRQGLL